MTEKHDYEKYQRHVDNAKYELEMAASYLRKYGISEPAINQLLHSLNVKVIHLMKKEISALDRLVEWIKRK